MAFSFPTITQTESRCFDLSRRFFVPGIALFDSSGKLIAGEGKAGELPLSNDSFAEMSLRYAILCSIIVDILDGSAYLFDKEAPERVSASERLAHIEELIASVEKVSKKKDGVNVFNCNIWEWKPY